MFGDGDGVTLRKESIVRKADLNDALVQLLAEVQRRRGELFGFLREVVNGTTSIIRGATSEFIRGAADRRRFFLRQQALYAGLLTIQNPFSCARLSPEEKVRRQQEAVRLALQDLTRLQQAELQAVEQLADFMLWKFMMVVRTLCTPIVEPSEAAVLADQGQTLAEAWANEWRSCRAEPDDTGG